MRLLSVLMAGLALVCLQATSAHAQPSGSNRLYIASGGSNYYLERDSLTDWSNAANRTWSDTHGGGVWELTDNGDGTWRIESGGKALTRNGTTDWSNVQTVTYAGWSGQKWTLTDNGDGTYRIENSGKALTGTASSGYVMRITTYSGWSTQKWHLVAEDKTGWPSGDWKWVYNNVNLSTQLLVDKADTLVINSTVHDVHNGTNVSCAFYVNGVSNVYIQSTDLLDIYTNHGLVVSNSSQVTIKDCLLSNLVRPSTVHSSFIQVLDSPYVAILGTTILGSDGNGILTSGGASTHLLIDGCTIDTTGRVPLSSTAPFHGIYSKAPDITYSNNTITNALDGSDISMRNTGILANNHLSAAKRSLIAYWPDDTAGASGSLIIRNNTLEQDNYDYSESTFKAALIGINDNGNAHNIPAPYFQTYIIQNNTMRVGSGSSSADPLVAANWTDTSPGYGDARVINNTLTDQRSVKTYFGDASRFVTTTPNTLQ